MATLSARRRVDMYPSAAELVAAAAADLVVGDPPWMPHPVRWIGRLIAWLEHWCVRLCGARHKRAAGMVLVAAAVGLPVGGVLLVLAVVDGWARFAFICYLVSTLLALASLDREASRVLAAVGEHRIELARLRLASIVGRDTRELEEPDIVRAVFETVAENLSDGVVAPVFYLVVAGVPGMVAYKCINTLDSMVGYRNERYAELGWAAARLDDGANYVPARISAAIVLLVAALCGLSPRAGWRAVRRDAPRQPSPNAGYPEAAVAGVLGVRLGGENRYFGRVVAKPFLGDAAGPPAAAQYPMLRQLLYGSALFAYTAAAATLYWIGGGRA